MKTICFVCAHGSNLSPQYEEQFNDFLRNAGIRDIDATHAGIGPELNGYSIGQSSEESLQRSNLIVSVLNPIFVSEAIRKYNPKAEIVYLDDVYIQSRFDNETMFEKLAEMTRTLT